MNQLEGIDDLTRAVQSGNLVLAQLVQAVLQLSRISSGTFTMAAAATKTITDTNVTANSRIILQATNAAAGTLQQSTEALYVSAKTSGTSFVVASADGGSPAGTETFDYLIFNPV